MRVVPIPLDKLSLDPSQPRTAMTDGDLDALAESIQARGLLLPLRVKPADANDVHIIVSGHRRYAALQKLGTKTAGCVIVSGPLDEATVLAEQLAENVLREDLSPVDEAAGFRRYLSLRGVTAARAAEELHVPPARISRALPLLDLPGDLQAAITAGQIPKDTGYYLARLPASADREELFARALAGSLTRDQAARAVRAVRSHPPEPATSRVTCKLAGGRSLTVTGSSITLDTLIEIVEDVLKEARKARAQGWDATTLAKVFRDRAAAGGAV
ncbi:MAG TPA: ParB/RepB/Spo0J family partition protein [Urbifossiella sp.]|jgi:ParB family chromosome partitioning protein|nr:ParB/RepB/Spo0J family partition protein [Urbifossiella sp.]